MRGLKILVIVMGVMLVLGVVGLGVGIAYRVNHHPSSATMTARALIPTHDLPYTVNLPSGTKILSIQSDGDRVMITLGRPDGGETLMLVDWRTGQKLSTLELKP